MTVITIARPAHVAVPRGAAWAASAALGLLSIIDRAIQSAQAAKAMHRRASEARYARQMAQRLAEFDPRVAREVEIAADRHEQGL